MSPAEADPEGGLPPHNRRVLRRKEHCKSISGPPTSRAVGLCCKRHRQSRRRTNISHVVTSETLVQAAHLRLGRMSCIEPRQVHSGQHVACARVALLSTGNLAVSACLSPTVPARETCFSTAATHDMDIAWMNDPSPYEKHDTPSDHRTLGRPWQVCVLSRSRAAADRGGGAAPGCAVT